MRQYDPRFQRRRQEAVENARRSLWEKGEVPTPKGRNGWLILAILCTLGLAAGVVLVSIGPVKVDWLSALDSAFAFLTTLAILAILIGARRK